MISKVLQFELQPQSDEWNPRTRMEKRSGHEDDGQGLAQLVRDDGASSPRFLLSNALWENRLSLQSSRLQDSAIRWTLPRPCDSASWLPLVAERLHAT